MLFRSGGGQVRCALYKAVYRLKLGEFASLVLNFLEPARTSEA